MTEASETVALEAELHRLIERVRPWSSVRWTASALGRSGSRADAVFALLELLAASSPSTPRGAAVPRLRDGALADQLAVVGDELLSSRLDAHVVAELTDAVRATRDAIEPPPIG